MSEYITSDGDQLDWICWRHYADTRNGVVESVLEANPGLADYGVKLPPGIRIVLPDLRKPAQVTEIPRLFD